MTPNSQKSDTLWQLYDGGAVLVRWMCLAAGLLLLDGCAAPVRTVRPSVDPNTLGETGFIHYLAATAVVTVDEGARAVLSLIGDDAARVDFDRRWDALAERRAVRHQWGVKPDSVLDRGSFAFMLCGVLDVPKGLNDRLAGATGLGERRAALRTAVFEGLLDYGPTHEPISGAEIASALARVEQWQIRHGYGGG